MEGVKTVVALDLTLTELPEICRALLQRIAESESELAEHSDEAVAKLEQQLAANAYRTERGAVLVRVAHPSQPGAADSFCAPTAGDAVLPLS